MKIKGEKTRRRGQRVVSRMATLFTVFAIVKAANIYVVFKRTRVLGVTRVLSASEETSRIVRKINSGTIRRRSMMQRRQEFRQGHATE